MGEGLRTLVVGGTGMVGPGVVGACAAAGDRTVVLHRGVTAGPLPDGVEVRHGDRHAQGALARVVAEVAPDVVIDLACYDAAEAETTVAACEGVERLVYVSSVAAVGGPVRAVIDERTEPAPVTEYGRGKLAAERVFASRPGSVSVRLGACYRTGTTLDGQLMEDCYWLGEMVAGTPAVVLDEAEALWNVLHADDAGRAIRGLAGADLPEEPVLVTSRRSVPWRRYYEIVYRAHGRQLRFESLPSDWVMERWGPGCFPHEMSAWDQRYDLGPLDGLVPGWEERVALEKGLPAATAWLVAEDRLGSEEAVAAVAGLVEAWRHATRGSTAP